MERKEANAVEGRPLDRSLHGNDETACREISFRSTSLFVVFLYGVSYVLTALLACLTLGFIVFQIYDLFGPFVLSKISNRRGPFRFPPYVYEVWGEGIDSLRAEHWGLLAVSVAFLSVACWVLWEPFSKNRKRKEKNA
mmetsp:Transcript_20965/g.41864  ORF Transcript_20965/g.41864 Transcript_20965/m.41864 type:complete len:138 (+) Transcript_20965:209-622(+)